MLQLRAAGGRRAVRHRRRVAPRAGSTWTWACRLAQIKLRLTPFRRSDEDYLAMLAELLAFFRGEFATGHPYGSVTGIPGRLDRLVVANIGNVARFV